MSALFVFFLQLLAAMGFPIQPQTGVLIGATPTASHSPFHSATYRDGDSDGGYDDPVFKPEETPCDISNGF
jgi:hypothetical protein